MKPRAWTRSCTLRSEEREDRRREADVTVIRSDKRESIAMRDALPPPIAFTFLPNEIRIRAQFR